MARLARVAQSFCREGKNADRMGDSSPRPDITLLFAGADDDAVQCVCAGAFDYPLGHSGVVCAAGADGCGVVASYR